MNNTNNQYPANIGALFKNQRRKTKQAPVLTGTIELDPSLVTHLSRLVARGEKAKLSLGGWKNKSRSGLSYFTIKASPEFKPDRNELPLDEDDDFDL